MSEQMLFTPGLAPRDGGFRDDDYWTWCGSVIQDEDGLYHMFASRWSKATPFAPNWLTNSRVVRAISETAEGPYRYVEDVIAPRGADYWDGLMAHNPTIHRYKDGYALFYTGSTYSGEVPTSGRMEGTDPRRMESRANQRIGVATAPHPAGPWTRYDKPIVEPREGKWDAMMTTNPAAVIHDDGSVIMLYKAVASQKSKLAYGVARAESLFGPYERLRDDTLFASNDECPSYEDAFVWHQDGRYHMIFNDLKGYFTGEDHAGAYAVSDDAINWEPKGKAYSRVLTWDDGETTHQGSFERPQVMMVDGKPAYLFAATADGPGGYSKADNTWTMVLPIAEVNFPE